MTDPIDNGPRFNRPVQTDGARGGGNVDGRQNPAQPAREGGGADQSQTSERLQAVREAIDRTPEVDSTRVQDIRERIANGEYPLDAERTAARVVELEQLLAEA